MPCHNTPAVAHPHQPAWLLAAAGTTGQTAATLQPHHSGQHSTPRARQERKDKGESHLRGHLAAGTAMVLCNDQQATRLSPVEAYILSQHKGSKRWDHRRVMGPVAQQFFADWRREWTVGRGADRLPAGGYHKATGWERLGEGEAHAQALQRRRTRRQRGGRRRGQPQRPRRRWQWGPHPPDADADGGILEQRRALPAPSGRSADGGTLLNTCNNKSRISCCRWKHRGDPLC